MQSEFHELSLLVHEVINELRVVAGWLEMQDPQMEESVDNFGVKVLEKHIDLFCGTMDEMRNIVSTDKSQLRVDDFSDMYKALSKTNDLGAQSVIKRAYMYCIVRNDIGVLRQIVSDYFYLSKVLMKMHDKLLKNMSILLDP